VKEVITIEQIKQANAEAGFCFFGPNHLRFFNTRVLPKVYEGPGGVYFITSEEFVSPDGWAPERKYTVRQFDPETGDIRIASTYARMSRSEALAAARRLAGRLEIRPQEEEAEVAFA
jgi:hypothetical protein